LLYTASYVETRLTPEEQRSVESEPGGAYVKANVLRSLDLKPQHLDALRTAMSGDVAPQSRDEQEVLFSIVRQLAISERPISTMELAGAMASMSYDAITDLIKRTSRRPRCSSRSCSTGACNDAKFSLSAA
jgi:hypothetical protein